MSTFVDTFPVFRFVLGTRIHGHACNNANDIVTNVTLTTTATPALIHKPGAWREAVEYFDNLVSILFIQDVYHVRGMFRVMF